MTFKATRKGIRTTIRATCPETGVTCERTGYDEHALRMLTAHRVLEIIESEQLLTAHAKQERNAKHRQYHRAHKEAA